MMHPKRESINDQMPLVHSPDALNAAEISLKGSIPTKSIASFLSFLAQELNTQFFTYIAQDNETLRTIAQQFITQELEFAEKVLTACKKWSRVEENIVLWDVDGTCGAYARMLSDNPKDVPFIIRPALPLVSPFIAERHWKFQHGVCTFRPGSQHYLIYEDGPLHFSKQFFDEKYLFSVNELAQYGNILVTPDRKSKRCPEIDIIFESNNRSFTIEKGSLPKGWYTRGTYGYHLMGYPAYRGTSSGFLQNKAILVTLLEREEKKRVRLIDNDPNPSAYLKESGLRIPSFHLADDLPIDFVKICQQVSQNLIARHLNNFSNKVR